MHAHTEILYLLFFFLVAYVEPLRDFMQSVLCSRGKMLEPSDLENDIWKITGLGSNIRLFFRSGCDCRVVSLVSGLEIVSWGFSELTVDMHSNVLFYQRSRGG